VKQLSGPKWSVNKTDVLKELAIVTVGEEDYQTNIVEEDKDNDSSNEFEGSEKSKYSGNKGSELGEDRNNGEEDAIALESVILVKVVESQEDTHRLKNYKKSSQAGVLATGKGKASTIVALASALALQKDVGDATILSKKRKVR